MRGRHELVVRNNRVQFKLSVERNLTILRGDSATGKTTLIGMVADWEEMGEDSGVSLSCDIPCTVLAGRNWERDLADISGSLVLIDEGAVFVASTDFARAARQSDNYYLIATRDTLPALPYSVDEVYGLRVTTTHVSKYPAIKRVYSMAYRVYGGTFAGAERPGLVVVEDSNAGFEFFSSLCARSGIPCISAKGKACVYDVVRASPARNVLVIADGAAFGPEMERVCSLRYSKNVRIYLPESFEWLVLSSGLFDSAALRATLANPSAYIESSEYFSWERFFTARLVEESVDSYLAYGKNRLNPAYLEDRQRAMIEASLPELGLSGA